MFLTPKYFIFSAIATLILTSCQASAKIKTLEDISYKNYDVNGEPRSLLLDLYIPQTSSEQSLPLLIFIHGGGWYEGSKEVCPGKQVAQAGYIMACINYRFSSEALFPAQIYDIKTAVRWLRENALKYQINPDKIGAWGYSAGGHLSILLGTSKGISSLEGENKEKISSQIQAVSNWYGPTDFSQVPPSFTQEITPQLLKDKNERRKAWFLYTLATHRLIGSPVSENPQLTQLANPINYIDSSDPPVFIMHGEKDNVVPISQSEILYDALKKNNVPVTFSRPQDRGHDFTGTNGESYDPQLIKETLDFFDQYLK
ncbi:MAG: alpha/beta hydrolase fold domain-containing protein [Microcystaceae cyanobacterium]